MPSGPPPFPPSRRLALLMAAHQLTAAQVADRAGLPVARVAAALNGATTDPHAIADRLHLSIGVVLAVRATPAGPHWLPVATVAAILDGAPPTLAELTRLAAVFGFPTGWALNDTYCPKCHAADALVQPVLCWHCGWRIVFAPEAA